MLKYILYNINMCADIILTTITIIIVVSAAFRLRLPKHRHQSSEAAKQSIYIMYYKFITHTNGLSKKYYYNYTFLDYKFPLSPNCTKYKLHLDEFCFQRIAPDNIHLRFPTKTTLNRRNIKKQSFNYYISYNRE